MFCVTYLFPGHSVFCDDGVFSVMWPDDSVIGWYRSPSLHSQWDKQLCEIVFCILCSFIVCSVMTVWSLFYILLLCVLFIMCSVGTGLRPFLPSVTSSFMRLCSVFFVLL